MEEFLNEPVLDFEECITFISDKTGVNKDMVMKVLDAESEFMIQAGIIISEE